LEGIRDRAIPCSSIRRKTSPRFSKTHRYRITAKGLRTATFYTRIYNRSLRTGLAVISPQAANANLPVARSIRAAEAALNAWFDQEKLAA